MAAAVSSRLFYSPLLYSGSLPPPRNPKSQPVRSEKQGRIGWPDRLNRLTMLTIKTSENPNKTTSIFSYKPLKNSMLKQVVMCARRLPLVAGVGFHVGLVDIEAKDIASQAGAKSAVADILEHEWVLLPVGAHRGISFRLADWSAVDMRGRSALFDQVAEGLLAGQPACLLFALDLALPELGHGNVVHTGALQRVNLVIEGARRFGMNGNAGL